MNETEIRQRLIERLRRQAQGSSAAFISELCIDRFERRVDLVQVGARLAAFEIKSDRDRLTRLPGQLDSYCRFFERVTVVCTLRHLTAVQAQTAATVGLWTVDAERGFKVVRPSCLLRGPRLEGWLSFLPVSELRRLLRSHDRPARGTREDLLVQAMTLSTAVVRAQVLASLRAREARLAPWRAQQGAMTDVLPRGAVPLTPEARLQAFLSRVAMPERALARRVPQPYSSSSV
jgi:hypothetical protein